MNIGILIISDRGSRGEYVDQSTPIIVEQLKMQPEWQITHQAIIPDEFETIVNTLNQWCTEGVHLLLTSGGTGFSPRDITPEATKRVIEREAPGIAEAVRADSLKITKHAMLSRAIAGIKDQTLIINMPGNPKAVRENLQFLLPVLPHALELIIDASGSEQGHRMV
jgi:molybdenum cofactor synthesis domain-containing protein